MLIRLTTYVTSSSSVCYTLYKYKVPSVEGLMNVRSQSKRTASDAAAFYVLLEAFFLTEFMSNLF